MSNMNFPLLSAVIGDVVQLGKSGFFGETAAQKKSLLAEVLGKEYPHTLTAFFLHADEKLAAVSLVEAMGYLEGVKTDLKSKSLLEAFAKYLCDEGWKDLHVAEKNSQTNQKSSLLRLIDNMSPSDRQIAVKQAIEFLKDSGAFKPLTYQTAVDANVSFKNTLHDEAQKKYPGYYLTFSVNSSLIGGMRCFKDGHMYDATWLSQIVH